MAKTKEYDWDEVLSAAARLQGCLRDAVLVGGTASALFAGHRTSYDADHILPDLRHNFDEIVSDLEAVAGWQTARVKRPVLILGSLDGIETGVRQLIRAEPLETTKVFAKGQQITVPTEGEILRIKGALILKRNATRDYLDFAALSAHLGQEQTVSALTRFDTLYPQNNGNSALQQLYIQLADPRPYDLRAVDFSTYKNLNEPWKEWATVETQCQKTACVIFNHYQAELHIEKMQHQHLLTTAPTYTEQIKTLVEAKEAQAQRIETRLEKQLEVQRDALTATQSRRPGFPTSLWKGAAWEKTCKLQQAGVARLESRLSRVKSIRTSMGGKRLEELARKKLQHRDPELVARHDAEQRVQREAQAQEALRQKALRQTQENERTQGRGRSLKHEM